MSILGPSGVRKGWGGTGSDCNPHMLHTPEPRNPQKVSKKGVPGPPGPECPKKSPSTDFVVFLTLFRVIWDFFDTFWTLAREHLFEAFWGFSGLGGVETPVFGDCNRKARVVRGDGEGGEGD